MKHSKASPQVTQAQVAAQIERVELIMIAVCQAETATERTRYQAILTQEREHLENMVLEFAKVNVIQA